MKTVEWISVKDRLPEKSGKYLVVHCFFGFRAIKVCCFSPNLYKVDKYIFPDEKRPGWYQSDSEVIYYECDGISHWAELPDLPPEEEVMPIEG